MTYEDQKGKYGKTPVFYIEIQADYCSNTYGLGPCTAAGPAAGKCFNTFPTCQDEPNYDATNNPTADPDLYTKRVYRFSSQRIPGLTQPGDLQCHPTIVKVSTTPTKLTPGSGLGMRSTLKVVISDHPWIDVDTDPYVLDRSYDPDLLGSYWGRWIARNKFFEGRVISVFSGYLDDNGDPDMNSPIAVGVEVHQTFGNGGNTQAMFFGLEGGHIGTELITEE